MHRYYRGLFIFIFVIFSGYNFLIYTNGSELPTLSAKAINGADLWQQQNCSACHQLYGLGGFLGPDLTNIVSHPMKGPAYAQAFLNSGIKAMPRFDFTKEEQESIVQFLKEVDQTGYFPVREAVVKKNGWVELNYKQPEKDQAK